ncbi:MAG: hypothetical protein FWD70_07150, partial [Desulfuromonadales bacterium]|nr:hypothetical protein [Desulfuromonadales bacterium]
MLYPSIEQIKIFAEEKKFKIAPLCTEIYSDCKTPIEVLRILKGVSQHCYMLESVEDSEKWGRYTFLGFDPVMGISCHNKNLTIKEKEEIHINTADPSAYIRKIMADNLSPDIPGMPPFTGGLVGYFSYDYIKYKEPTLELDAKDEENFKDLDLMLFDKVIAFDNLKQKIILIANIKLQDIEKEYERGVAELDKLKELIKQGNPAENKKLRLKTPFVPLFKKEQYCQMVEKAKEH